MLHSVKCHRTDRANANGSPSHERLLAVSQLVDAHPLLDDGPSHVTQDLDNRHARDTRQDGSRQAGRSNGAILRDDEDVASSHLLNIAVFHRVQVEAVVLARLLLCLLLGKQRRCVVANRLDTSASAAARAVKPGLNVQVDGVCLLATEVASNGARVDDETVRGCGKQSELRTRAKHHRAKVQRSHAVRRNVRCVSRDTPLHRVDEELDGRGRHAQATAALLCTFGVFLGPEDGDTPVRCTVRLHALKQSLSVVQHAGSGAHLKRPICHDTSRGCCPHRRAFLECVFVVTDRRIVPLGGLVVAHRGGENLTPRFCEECLDVPRRRRCA
mmetsp:Transcript_7659/g.17450  ORF Transcript_7659/g.17450 Transcript_7659/m.17450 type:complete len:328 (+) Transcript_7659:273-1256(+)